MVTCGWVQNRILAYLSDELGVSESSKLYRHVQKCLRCQKAMELLSETQDVAGATLMTNVRAPAAIDARIMAAISGRRPDPVRRFRFWNWWRK
ncbi:MAG TPA: hypothetical protein VGM51_04900 [Armatimonadota bacterium]|jgi:anti-sigma factor RsiW